MEIRALREDDERSFHSGDAELDRFFHQFAGQNQFRHFLGVTYVAVEEHQILGYATVVPGHIEIESLPVTMRKKLPKYPLPVLRLARLAVAGLARGRGLGAELLRFVLRLAIRMADEYGCVGVIVDAKPDAVRFYAKYGFVATDPLEDQSHMRPQTTLMFLSMRKIKGDVGN
jgi:GNAT superfamily N-acetyltransferase